MVSDIRYQTMEPGCIPCKQHAEGTPSSSKCYAKRMKRFMNQYTKAFSRGLLGHAPQKNFEILQAPGAQAISAWNFLIKYTKYFLDYTPARQRLYNRTPVRQAFFKSMPKMFGVTYRMHPGNGGLLYKLKGLSIGKHNKSYSIEKRLPITKIEVKMSLD